MDQPIDEKLIQQTLQRLNSPLRDKESPVDVIRQVGATASPATLFQLAIDVGDKPTISELEAAHADTYRYYISKVLADKPGIDSAQACMDILLMPFLCNIELRHQQPRAERWLREIACAFASEQPVDVLAELFLRHSEKDNWQEFFSVLLQEMVLHEIDVQNLPAVIAHHERMRQRKHPLAILPLIRLEIEPQTTTSMTVRCDVAVEAATTPTPDAETTLTLAAAADITTDSDRNAIEAVVFDRRTYSNGLAESKVLAFPQWVDAAMIHTESLRALKGIFADSRTITPITAEEVFEELFQCAASPGCYSRGRGHAYARLDAWRSLRGLAGIDGEYSFAGDERIAKQCCWLIVDCGGSWFYGIWHDLMLAAIRPDRKSIAYLAVTDTD